MAEQADRTDALGRILSEILFSRLYLFIISTPLILGGYWAAGGNRIDLAAAWMTVPLAYVFISYWFYQGCERNLPAAVLTLAARLATVIAALLLVREPRDAIWVPLVIGIPLILAGLVSVLVITRSYGLTLRPIGWRAFVAAMRSGKEIFASNISVILYRDFNVVFLKIAGVPAGGIATYSLIEKLVKMLQAGMRPASQLFFPKVVRTLRNYDAPSLASAREIVRFTWPQLAFAIAIIVGTALLAVVGRTFSPEIQRLLSLPDVITVAALMLPSIVFGVANFMFGTAGLNYLGRRAYFFVSVLATGICSAVACIALASTFGVVGAAAAFVGAEALLLCFIAAAYVRSPANEKRKGGI